MTRGPGSSPTTRALPRALLPRALPPRSCLSERCIFATKTIDFHDHQTTLAKINRGSRRVTRPCCPCRRGLNEQEPRHDNRCSYEDNTVLIRSKSGYAACCERVCGFLRGSRRMRSRWRGECGCGFSRSRTRALSSITGLRGFLVRILGSHSELRLGPWRPAPLDRGIKGEI